MEETTESGTQFILYQYKKVLGMYVCVRYTVDISVLYDVFYVYNICCLTSNQV